MKCRHTVQTATNGIMAANIDTNESYHHFSHDWNNFHSCGHFIIGILQRGITFCQPVFTRNANYFHTKIYEKTIVYDGENTDVDNCKIKQTNEGKSCSVWKYYFVLYKYNFN